MKRLVSCILMAVLLLTVLPALADATRTSGLYTYEIKGNGTITITGFNWREHSGDVFIPAMIDGYTVAGIGDSAFKDGGKFNGNSPYGYGESNNPVKVVLPDTIKSIGSQAFFNAGITEINIPVSVQYIGYGAFADCPYLHFIVSQGHPYFAIIDKALYSKTNKELLYYPSRYQGYEDLVIPEGIVSIGDYALCHAYRTEEGYTITLPTTLRKIGNYAFLGASVYITDNFLPEQLESIGTAAFRNARIGGKSLTLPASVSSIGEECFYYTSHDLYFEYGPITIPYDSALTVIPTRAFQFCEFNIYLYSTKLERIEDFAFCTDYFNRNSQRGVLYPLNVENEVDYGLFENLEYVGIGAFSYSLRYDGSEGECVIAKAEDKTFPAKLSTINAHFNFDILIPASVHTIEANAYDQVVNDFYLPTTLTQISPKAFAQGSTFIVEAGSYAELWALENGFDYSIEGQDNLDWLNN